MALGGTYNTGKAGVTVGSTAVTGHGVLWSGAVEGDTLTVGAAIGKINSVNGTFDGITLKDGWAGPTVPQGTATVTIASPGVVTWPATAPPDGTPVLLSTTGALPTGLVAATIYYCKSPSGSTSNLAATSGGAAINTSGTQSGTHTIGASYRIYYDSVLRFDPALTQQKVRNLVDLLETAAVFGVPFEWDTGTSDADPGAGVIRANNASLASATLLYISKTSRAGAGIAAFLAGLDDSTNPSSKGTLILGAQPEGTQAIFTVGAVTDATNYIKLAISGASGVTTFVDGDLINFQFIRTGDLPGGAITATSLALGGATLGTNALAVTGTSILSGNVGIGTTSPNALLEIKATVSTTQTKQRWKGGNSDSYYWLDLIENAYSSNGDYSWAFSANAFNGGTRAFLTMFAGASPLISVGANINVSIASTTASTSTTTGALVVGGGVGIGGAIFGGTTISAAGRLTAGNNSAAVSTDQAFTFRFSSNSGIAGAIQDATFNAGGAFMQFFVNGNSTVMGSITSTSTSVTAFNTSSDVRLKPDRILLTAGRKIIDALKVYDHSWLNSDDRGIGIVAQEAVSVIPQMITRGDDDLSLRPGAGGFKTWLADYSKAVPHLIVAQQETFRMIDDHERVIEQLTGELAIAQSRIATLEATRH